MALNLTTLTQFTGKITAASLDYPYGSSKNETTTGAGDGTPYTKIRADDVFGFQQSLLTAAGLTPSGDPDTVQDAQYLDSIVGLLWYEYANYPIGATTIRNGRKFRAIVASGPKAAYGGAAVDPITVDNGYWVPDAPITQNQIPDNSKIVPSITADATPRDVAAGEVLSDNWFVGTALSQMTYVDGKYNADSGTIYRDIDTSLGLEYIDVANLVGSYASADRIPKTTGVTVTDNGDGTYRITIDFSSATDVFSARLEVGAYPYMHDLGETGGSGGAKVGIFWENDQEVPADYTVASDVNAGSFGPITVPDGVVVTVNGVWTIV